MLVDGRDVVAAVGWSFRIALEALWNKNTPSATHLLSVVDKSLTIGLVDGSSIGWLHGLRIRQCV